MADDKKGEKGSEKKKHPLFRAADLLVDGAVLGLELTHLLGMLPEWMRPAVKLPFVEKKSKIKGLADLQNETLPKLAPHRALKSEDLTTFGDFVRTMDPPERRAILEEWLPFLNKKGKNTHAAYILMIVKDIKNNPEGAKKELVHTAQLRTNDERFKYYVRVGVLKEHEEDYLSVRAKNLFDQLAKSGINELRDRHEKRLQDKKDQKTSIFAILSGRTLLEKIVK